MSIVELGVGEDLDGLLDDLECLDGRELGECLQELERRQRRLEHAIVTVVAAADRRAVWAEDGHRGVRGWCQATVNWSGAEATHRVRSATLLADLSAVGEALARGEIGVAQIRELARARANQRCGDELAEIIDTLLPFAKSLPFDEFRRVVQRWEVLADADGAHRDHEQTHATRSASLQPVGNGFDLKANCGVGQGATMREILDAFCDAEFHADWEAARARLGENVTPGDLARTAAQRRMDALYAIFLAAASAPPGSRPPEPVVNIVVDQATFEAAMAAMAADSPLDDFMPAGDPMSRRCETIHGDLVDPCDAVIAALIGQVRRVVFDSASCTIDLGVTSRLFRGASRMAVWLQGGTRCLWPGCGRRHCQVDHTRPWSEHGPTAPWNGGPACDHHNIWKTRGYHTWRDPDGRWHVVRPDGTEINPI